MTKEFIPYEQALALKKLGYNERGFGFYEKKKLVISTWLNSNSYLKIDFEKGKPRITAPTFSQTFKWFREKYNLRGFIGFRPNDKQFTHHVYDMSLSGKEYVKQRTMEEFNKDPKVGSYEEAELACIIKLIEIVKTK